MNTRKVPPKTSIFQSKTYLEIRFKLSGVRRIYTHTPTLANAYSHKEGNQKSNSALKYLRQIPKYSLCVTFVRKYRSTC
jgi:hypothetical protein